MRCLWYLCSSGASRPPRGPRQPRAVTTESSSSMSASSSLSQPPTAPPPLPVGQEGGVSKQELNKKKAARPLFHGGIDKPAVGGRERSDVVGVLLPQLGQLGERKDGHGVDLLMARERRRRRGKGKAIEETKRGRWVGYKGGRRGTEEDGKWLRQRRKEKGMGKVEEK